MAGHEKFRVSFWVLKGQFRIVLGKKGTRKPRQFSWEKTSGKPLFFLRKKSSGKNTYPPFAGCFPKKKPADHEIEEQANSMAPILEPFGEAGVRADIVIEKLKPLALREGTGVKGEIGGTGGTGEEKTSWFISRLIKTSRGSAILLKDVDSKMILQCPSGSLAPYAPCYLFASSPLLLGLDKKSALGPSPWEVGD